MFLDNFTLRSPILGFSSFALAVRHSLPKYMVPLVLTALYQTVALFERDEAIFIPNLGNNWENLVTCVHASTLKGPPLTEHRYRIQFDQMEAESNQSPGVFQQLRLLGLSWRLYKLKLRIEAFKREIEVRLPHHSSDLF